MQDQNIAEKETIPLNGRITPLLLPSAGKIPLPRCQCCGALIPLIKAAACINDIASCMVCGHRNP